MKFVPNAVTVKMARQVLIAKKHSPRILFVVGVAGAVSSTVLACRATLKLEKALDDIGAEVADVKKDLAQTDGYGKDLAFVYVKGAANIGQLYAPALIVGTLSIGALTGSHITLTRRNAGLTAAYAAVSQSYTDYRDRVREEVGTEKEYNLFQGVQIKEVEDADGKKAKLSMVDPNKMSAYARFFDEFSPRWQKNAEYNKIFLQAQQNYFNFTLQSRGHVFLNEVYDNLGIERTTPGAVVGWVLGNGGDDYIDFKMFETGNEAFVNGYERSILLDFNVDGPIYNLLG